MAMYAVWTAQENFLSLQAEKIDCMGFLLLKMSESVKKFEN